MTGFLYMSRADRLGGRMLTLYATLYEAQLHNLPFRIHWPDFFDFEINNYEELFSQDFISRHFLTDEEAEKITPARISGLMTPQQAEAIRSRGMIGEVDITALPDAPLKFPGDGFFDLVDFHPDIRQAMQATRAMLGDFDALHIRYGDLLQSDRMYGKTIPLDFYLKLLDDFDFSARNLVVFTDTPEIATFIRQRYPVKTAEDIHAAVGLTSLQAALIDMFLMADADRLYSGGSSNFSILAARLGGKKRIQLPGHYKDALPELFERFLDMFEAVDNPQENMLGNDIIYHSIHFFLRKTRLPEDKLRQNLVDRIFGPRGAGIADAPEFGRSDRILLALTRFDPVGYAALVDEVLPNGHQPPQRLYGDEMTRGLLTFLHELSEVLARTPRGQSGVDALLTLADKVQIIFNNRRTLRPTSLELAEVLSRSLLNALPDPRAVFSPELWAVRMPPVSLSSDRYFDFNTPARIRNLFLTLSASLVGTFNAPKFIDMQGLTFRGETEVLDFLHQQDPETRLITLALYLGIECHRKDDGLVEFCRHLQEAFPGEVARLRRHTQGQNHRLANSMERLFRDDHVTQR